MASGWCGGIGCTWVGRREKSGSEQWQDGILRWRAKKMWKVTEVRCWRIWEEKWNCAPAVSLEEDRPLQREERMRRKRATVNQQSGTWRTMENCGWGEVWDKDKACWISCWNYYRLEKLQTCSHWRWHQDFSFPFTVNHNLLITLAKTSIFQQMSGPLGSII